MDSRPRHALAFIFLTVLIDSIGFGDEHRAAAHRIAGLPVLQASDLVARITGACLLDVS